MADLLPQMYDLIHAWLRRASIETGAKSSSAPRPPTPPGTCQRCLRHSSTALAPSTASPVIRWLSSGTTRARFRRAPKHLSKYLRRPGDFQGELRGVLECREARIEIPG